MNPIRYIFNIIHAKRRYDKLQCEIMNCHNSAQMLKTRQDTTVINDPFMKGYAVGEVDGKINVCRDLLRFSLDNK